ncbi:hypothetical protein LBMAG21_06990 [Armatimonadota bacterium]|nr:hypothetical protein LBMAG21_06990 [Armatimonadota bacterium]
MPEFEFVVVGQPTSFNTKGKGRPQKKKRDNWQDNVKNAARKVMPPPATLLPVEVFISTYFTRQPVDVDNVLKDIMDAMNGVAYNDDKQVYKVTSERVYLKTLDSHSVFSPLLGAHIAKSPEFVHIRLFWSEEGVL